MRGLKHLAFLCLICLTIIVGLDYNGGKTVAALNGKTEKEPQTEKQSEALPTVGSHQNLLKILEEAQPMMTTGMADTITDSAVMNKTAALQVTEAAAFSAGNSLNAGGTNDAVGPDYSRTNIQVQGVDEADTVKTDGGYIYKITNNMVIVAKAYPAQEMKVVSTLNFGQEMQPVEMYADNKHLIVILNRNDYHGKEVNPADSGNRVRDKEIMPMPFSENSVIVLIYDLSDRTNLKKIREVEIDGRYVSSRKIENNLYLVNNRNIPVHLLKEQPELLTTPAYKDSAEGEMIKRVGYEDICYFPGSSEPNYLILAGINLQTLTDKKTEIKTYLGSGQNIYCSLENLFVAVPQYKYEKPMEPAARGTGSRVKSSVLPMPVEEKTGIYKFGLQDGNTEYLGKGSVPGRILNQFSMDESKGYFRIATTDQEYTPNGVKMNNHLFILDQGMKVAGKIENIAPGEKIYSVRFLGDRGYLVTFKTVDPLFVLDLKDPQNPSILGELKIPGYSNYLHPYDENHLIGFGKETVEVEEPHWSGQGTVKNAYYLGMKIALFDVSEVSNPIEKFKVEIGDRGTDSELFWNHKALLFNKEKGIMAFPVTVYDIDPATVSKDDDLAKRDSRLAYGRPVFQGAFVYSLSMEKGFELKGMITHQRPGLITDLRETGQYDNNRQISRSLYIENVLYTISNGYVQANDLNTLRAIGGIQILN